MKDQPFICVKCGEEFIAAWTEEEAIAEAEELFGRPTTVTERVMLCDGCYGAFVKWFEQLTPEQHREIQRTEAA